jgi:uncharacterized protein (DUF2225 family)
MADPLYSIEKECAVCEEKFAVTCVRSRLSLIKQDSDFCAYYKDINPYYYTVWVCPHCGYAARDTEFPGIMPPMVIKIKKFLGERAVKVNLGGNRTREQAIVSYQLAIFYSGMIGASASKLAGLYLRLAWLYREGGLPDEEQKTLIKACESYEHALSTERMPIGNMSELAVMYLIGDLLRRTGENEKAMLYLSKVVSSPLSKIEKRIGDLARASWQEIRAIKAKEIGDLGTI